jgi:hypothetical protein
MFAFVHQKLHGPILPGLKAGFFYKAKLQALPGVAAPALPRSCAMQNTLLPGRAKADARASLQLATAATKCMTRPGQEVASDESSLDGEPNLLKLVVSGRGLIGFPLSSGASWQYANLLLQLTQCSKSGGRPVGEWVHSKAVERPFRLTN